MIDTPEIVLTEPRHAAVIRLAIPREAIRAVMGPAIAEVMAALEAQGLAASGPVFSHHYRMDPAFFDFDVGIPVDGIVAPTGRVKEGRLPGAKAARTVYHGGYEGLGAAWGELEAWVASRELERAPDLWECYLAGPESSPDPADWRTELVQPLLG
ncbi:MAG TPA: GyrI-like domain-containing protein [Longimicrobiales bacterium]|nr:GyrI-like domain-containing protein [Longimicrobiales bacterium]